MLIQELERQRSYIALARWIKEFWIESAWRLRSTRRQRYH